MNEAQMQFMEGLYLEMFSKLMAYARSSLDSETLAEEAVQETFRIACQKPEELSESANPQGWLVNTLKNTIRNIKRNRANAQKLAETYLWNQLEENLASEDKRSLELLYGSMADTEEFKLLTEMAVEGKSHEEMARDRGISISACKKRVQRAKEILQKKLEL